ncbi:phytanoyl-CoA dioxygenase family protein [Falsiroseomonas stagni]|uniref:Phytanoyl-CoA dioxygenase (PhyH) n=1 Tax=Falsiroseomonas stagni DSM 19981 TaxID=1123062 RepID=A0A1I4D152_9PROT|nr:phytanoyl-CoA dioxygenase family protein [Falsiroseomonas stagni]SFK87222.1 Phytanoyl-CoA dioxygenase (PhyH) [Falsiroseomonas stagni DSM 19981]
MATALNPLRWLLLPWHALRVATSEKAFRDNPVIGSPRLNRLGLHIARKRLAHRMAARRRAAMASLLTDDQRAAFLRDGYLVIPDFLPPERFEAMRAEVMARDARARESIDGYTMTRLIPLDAIALRQMPATRGALLTPRYLGLHHYIGSFRRLPRFYVQTIFSGVRDGPPDVQSHYHTDTFFPTVKSWLLLTPVNQAEAGFTYIPGSHLPNRRHLAWERCVSFTAHEGRDRLTGEGSLRITEAELARLRYAPPRKLEAQPNTLIIADTSGFHRRGLSEGFACRISIWAQSRGSPFLPWAGGDMRIPALQGAATRAFGWLDHAVKRLRGRDNGWRFAGTRRPADPPAA